MAVMMNKVSSAALILSLTLLLVITACSRDEPPKTSPEATPTIQPPVDAETSSGAPLEAADASPDAEKGSAIEAGEQESSTQKSVVENTTTPEVQSATQATTENITISQETGSAQAHEEQLALARKSGCLACHAVDKKVVGPAWRDVSARYKDDPNAKAKLIAKVSKGGKGNWTDVVGSAAMPPYSPRVSEQNIALLVEFVLSLER